MRVDPSHSGGLVQGFGQMVSGDPGGAISMDLFVHDNLVRIQFKRPTVVVCFDKEKGVHFGQWVISLARSLKQAASVPVGVGAPVNQ